MEFRSCLKLFEETRLAIVVASRGSSNKGPASKKLVICYWQMISFSGLLSLLGEGILRHTEPLELDHGNNKRAGRRRTPFSKKVTIGQVDEYTAERPDKSAENAMSLAACKKTIG